MSFRATLTLTLGLGGLLFASVGWTQETQPTEYQIKAAYLYNFAKFVEWPSAALPEAASPIVVGILGQNPFHDDLARTIQNKSIDSHPLVIKEFRTLAEATNCHILFISRSEKKRLAEVFAGLKATSVLTVGEMDGFADAGGMINFVLQGSKVRFQINKEAAAQAGLKISSKLLSLAWRPAG